ncbi:hypothetical protein BVX97_00995 [bacterium E08(2017)]|nr:hypothetical protein BVX97_00995 [bacterium E08(2017)]
MLKILNIEPENYSPEALAILETVGDVEQSVCKSEDLSGLLDGVDVLITRLAHSIDRRTIDSSPSLKAIVTATTGLTHIDVEYAETRGIKVLSLRGETEFLRTIPATAELSWSLLLALVRRLVPAAVSVRSGEWNRDLYKGHDLAGKRLGIVGLGRIGQRVAEYGKAFGMDVSAYDPYVEEWPSDVTKSESLDQLATKSDVLMVHVTSNEETLGLVSSDIISRLPEWAVIVNTSRGEVIDNAALLEAVDNRQILGAALDVLPDELDESSTLRSKLIGYSAENDNLLITPHIGGATIESMAMTEVFMAKKLAEWARGLEDA